MLLGSMSIKAARKALLKLTTGCLPVILSFERNHSFLAEMCKKRNIYSLYSSQSTFSLVIFAQKTTLEKRLAFSSIVTKYNEWKLRMN